MSIFEKGFSNYLTLKLENQKFCYSLSPGLAPQYDTTACQTDQFLLNNQVYDCIVCYEYCVNFQMLLPMTTTNYDGSRL